MTKASPSLPSCWPTHSWAITISTARRTGVPNLHCRFTPTATPPPLQHRRYIPAATRLHTLPLTTPPPLHHRCYTAAATPPPLHHCCTTDATPLPLHHRRDTAQPPLHHRRYTQAATQPPLHSWFYTTAASPLPRHPYPEGQGRFHIIYFSTA